LRRLAPRLRSRFAREIPLGRVGQPEDYARVVVALAGPDT
jgi:NAD(P)-dependent dehydrogenase (short-subunit alcohol dehydrogenase family)